MPSSPKHILAYVGALGALALGGSAIANAATSSSPTPAPTATTQVAEQPGTEANDPAEAPGTETKDGAEAPGTEAKDGAEKGGDSESKVSAADAKKAGDAALASVGSGKVGDVGSETPDPNEAADKPDKGEQPAPAFEKNAAYSVEITKADGSVVDVSLDKSFKVLGTQAAEQGDQGGEGGQNEQNDSAEVAPTK